MKLATSFQRSDSPPWQGGVDATSGKMPRSLLVWSGRGGLFHYRLIGGLDEPPRLRPLRRLRIFLLMGAATPPWPRRGICVLKKNANYWGHFWYVTAHARS